MEKKREFDEKRKVTFVLDRRRRKWKRRRREGRGGEREGGSPGVSSATGWGASRVR